MPIPPRMTGHTPICMVSSWMYPGPWTANPGLSIPVPPVAPLGQRAGEHRVHDPIRVYD